MSIQRREAIDSASPSKKLVLPWASYGIADHHTPTACSLPSLTNQSFLPFHLGPHCKAYRILSEFPYAACCLLPAACFPFPHPRSYRRNWILNSMTKPCPNFPTEGADVWRQACYNGCHVAVIDLSMPTYVNNREARGFAIVFCA